MFITEELVVRDKWVLFLLLSTVAVQLVPWQCLGISFPTYHFLLSKFLWVKLQNSNRGFLWLQMFNFARLRYYP